MATKPSTLPEWATVGADVVEPLLAEKQLGWVLATRPPAQWFNWWQLLVYQWVVWLNAFESEAHTWSVVQTFGDAVFNGEIAFNQTSIYGATSTIQIEGAFDVLPAADPLSLGQAEATAGWVRNSIGGTTERVFVSENKDQTAPGIGARTYVTQGATFRHELTINAKWNHGTNRWVRDTGTKHMRRVLLDPDGFRVQQYRGVAADINDTSDWEDLLNLTQMSTEGALYYDADTTLVVHRPEIPYDSSGDGTTLPIQANVGNTITSDYTRNFLGETVLSGMLTANTTISSGTQIASLPVGFRPKRETFRRALMGLTGFVFNVAGPVWLRFQTNGRIDLMNDGTMVPASGFTVLLDGISFDADF